MTADSPTSVHLAAAHRMEGMMSDDADREFSLGFEREVRPLLEAVGIHPDHAAMSLVPEMPLPTSHAVTLTFNTPEGAARTVALLLTYFDQTGDDQEFLPLLIKRGDDGRFQVQALGSAV
jgi:hypothetical protein